MQHSYTHVVCSSIIILKHPSMYQNNHSQVLVIISVKITIVNKFQNFFWFCIAHNILHHLSAVILLYRFKLVTGNFRYWHTPILKKVGGVNQPPRRKHNNNLICKIFLMQLFQNLLRGTKTVLVYFLNIVMLHDVIYIQNKVF